MEEPDCANNEARGGLLGNLLSQELVRSRKDGRGRRLLGWLQALGSSRFLIILLCV